MSLLSSSGSTLSMYALHAIVSYLLVIKTKSDEHEVMSGSIRGLQSFEPKVVKDCNSNLKTLQMESYANSQKASQPGIEVVMRTGLGYRAWRKSDLAYLTVDIDQPYREEIPFTTPAGREIKLDNIADLVVAKQANLCEKFKIRKESRGDTLRHFTTG